METPLLKIDSIRRCLTRVSEMASLNPTFSDQNALDVTILNLQRACEQSLDLANWVCAYRNLSVPRTSREVFTILENAGILSPLLATNMRRMIGFRNIAIHEYQKLDPAIVKSIVFNRLGDFEDLIKCISLHLNIQPLKNFTFSEFKPQTSRSQIVFLSVLSANIRGDDLGNDYQLEISSGESQVCLRLKKAGDKLLLPKYSMMTFLLGSEIEKMNIRLLAKEIDPVSDDIGEQNLNINTAASIIDAQQIETNITIKGAGRSERNLIAVLDVKLAVSKSPGTAQIGDIEPNGWVIAKLASGALVPLASGTAVELKSIRDEREQFEILEGNHKGVTASIATDKNRFTHLCPLTGRNPASSLKLFRDRWILQINSLGEFAVLPLDARDMIFPGSYKISLPDAPHRGGRRLRSSAKHAESWFRIGDEGERYIHPGSRSKGCITVTDLTKWELIFQHLANSRLDEYHVGIMEVI